MYRQHASFYYISRTFFFALSLFYIYIPYDGEVKKKKKKKEKTRFCLPMNKSRIHVVRLPYFTGVFCRLLSVIGHSERNIHIDRFF